jgi:hypothetical protein
MTKASFRNGMQEKIRHAISWKATSGAAFQTMVPGDFRATPELAG